MIVHNVRDGAVLSGRRGGPSVLSPGVKCPKWCFARQYTTNLIFVVQVIVWVIGIGGFGESSQAMTVNSEKARCADRIVIVHVIDYAQQTEGNSTISDLFRLSCCECQPTKSIDIGLLPARNRQSCMWNWRSIEWRTSNISSETHFEDVSIRVANIGRLYSDFNLQIGHEGMKSEYPPYSDFWPVTGDKFFRREFNRLVGGFQLFLASLPQFSCAAIEGECKDRNQDRREGRDRVMISMVPQKTTGADDPFGEGRAGLLAGLIVGLIFLAYQYAKGRL